MQKIRPLQQLFDSENQTMFWEEILNNVLCCGDVGGIQMFKVLSVRESFPVFFQIFKKNSKKRKKGRYLRFLPKTLSDFQYQGVVVEV